MSKIVIKVSNCSALVILDILNKNKIPTKNFTKLDDSTVQFEINKKLHQNLLLIFKDKCYNVSVVKSVGIANYLHQTLKHIGVAIGCIIVLSMSIFLGRFTFYINVFGLSSISKDTLIQCLSDYGVRVGKINSFNNADLERYIVQNIDQVSLVSVINRGNTITINVKEKLPQNSVEYECLYAPVNMVITSLNVIKGTTKLKVGSIVKKGEVLVYPYYVDSSGTKCECNPMASIVADTYFCASVEFKTDVVEYVKTGNKTKNVTYYLGSKVIYSANKQCKYEYSSVETKNIKLLSHWFVPLMVKYNYTYELAPKQVHYNFDEYKDRCIAESVAKAKALVPSGYMSLDTTTTIKDINSVYLITSYIKSRVEVNNVN